MAASTNGVGQGQYQESYTYGPIGNLLTKNGVTYGYSDPAHVHAVTHLTGTQRYWYDANGNMTSRTENGLTYTQVWNAENRLASVSGAATAQFNYDGDGNRIVKVDASGTTLYLGAAYEKNLTTNVVTKYYSLGGQRIAVRQGITLTYLHADALGSASLATTVTGTLLSQRRYLPYGETRWSSSPFPTDRRYTGQREESVLVGGPLRGSARRQQPRGRCPFAT